MSRTRIVYRGSEIISQEEFDVTWEMIRQQRDILLQKSDWRAVKDRVLPNEWKDYRQALRDLPQDHEEANDAADAFPEAPDE